MYMQVKTGDAIVGNALWDTRFGLEGFQSGQVASSWERECWVGLACLSLLLRCGWLGVVLCGSCCFVGRLCWSRVGSGSRGQNGYLVGDRNAILVSWFCLGLSAISSSPGGGIHWCCSHAPVSSSSPAVDSLPPKLKQF